MLKVTPLEDVEKAASYYEADNYYVKGSIESIAATHWFGQGAAALGLSDYVDPERFIELLSGKIDAETTISRIRHDGGVEHKPGYDLTFSAPKSVSMLAEIGKDFRILEAHDRAVNAALTYIESHAVYYRQTVNGYTKIKRGDQLVVAKFRHDTSRSVDDTIDCQTHTHCVVMNMTPGEDGKWRSLSEKSLFDFQMTGGMVYRAALAQELMALGYEIEKTREDGLFEVAGFTREQIEAFSKRRVKILEVMKAEGLFGTKAAQAVALGTREAKVPIEREKLDAHWQARIQELNIPLDEMVEKAKVRAAAGIQLTADPAVVAGQAVEYAIRHLGERQSVFESKDLIRVTLQYALGQTKPSDIEAALERFQSQGDLVYLGEKDEQPLYTSAKIIQQEQALIANMKQGQQTVDALASYEAVALYLKDLNEKAEAEGFQPTHCQLKAIEFLATTTDRVVGIQGYAGTGKTTMLQAVCEIAKQAGYQIRGAAPSAAAKGVLHRETGIETYTLSKLLHTLAEEVAPEDPADAADKPELIILDEASMASTKQLHDLIEYASTLNKRLFLVGDRQQLAAVENGAPFTLLLNEGMAAARLVEIVRQEAPDLKFAVKETIQGDLTYAAQAIGNPAFNTTSGIHGATFQTESSVHEIGPRNKNDKPAEKKAERLAAMAEAYLSFDAKKRQETMVILGSNGDRRTVNEYIRDGLKAKGAIVGDEISCQVFQNKGFTVAERTHIHNYQVGDILQFNKAYRSLGIKRGDYVSVVGIDKKTETLQLQSSKDSKRMAWQPGKSAQSKGSAVEVYEKVTRTLAAGDRIRWTKNQNAREIFNSEMADVLSVSKDNHSAKVRLRSGETIDLNLNKDWNCHWDYAFCSTVYAAQGSKARHVITQLESGHRHLTTFSAFYVSLSRAVNSLHLYVDNFQEAIKTVQKYSGQKSNALTFLLSQQNKEQTQAFVKAAAEKLGDNLHVDENLYERLLALSNDYLQAADRSRVQVVATDFQDRKRLNALIRAGLKQQGKIGDEEASLNSLREYRLRQSDVNPIPLRVGMVLHFNRGHSKRNIQKNDYLTVSEIREIENTIVLESRSGKKAEVPLAFLLARPRGEITTYQVDRLELAVGDEIYWTKTFYGTGILKDQMAKVTAIDSDYETISFTLENGENLTIEQNSPEAMHWQYAYALGIDGPVPKRLDLALAHLDERTISPHALQTIFATIGRAKQGQLYTHSEAFASQALSELSGEVVHLKSMAGPVAPQATYQALATFAEQRKNVGRAWVSYFERKKRGADAEVQLKAAVILERAQGELAEQIIYAKDFDRVKVAALGFDVDRMFQAAAAHEARGLIEHYQKAQGLQKERAAQALLANHTQAMKKAWQQQATIDPSQTPLNWKTIKQEAESYEKRRAKLMLSPAERKDAQIMAAYLDYQKEASTAWRRVYQAFDINIAFAKGRFAYASHVTSLRNQLAQEMVANEKRFERWTAQLKPKSRHLMAQQAKQHERELAQATRRAKALASKDWRLVVSDEQQASREQRLDLRRVTYSEKSFIRDGVVSKSPRGEKSHEKNQTEKTEKTQERQEKQQRQQRQKTAPNEIHPEVIKKPIKPERKIYFDREAVLNAAIPKAEQIISNLISEQKNQRLSRGNKIVWGQKHGSVQFHIEGPKAGVVNDYERNIHGDIITYYAKSRGMDWYDGIKALAADIGLSEAQASQEKFVVSEAAIAKKQAAILAEQKRREHMRQFAEKTWNESQPIAGTLAETYLKKHRGATFDVNQLSVRYHPKAPIYTTKNGKLEVFDRRPAMVVAFRDGDEIKAVQCTYLDPKTANKDKTVQVGKMTVGSQWGAAGLIYAGGDDKVIVAEGAETALSLVEVEPNATIYITGGNMQNAGHYGTLALLHGQSTIHIAADNDLSIEAGSFKATLAGAKELAEKGIEPLIYQPEVLLGQKTDFNDVYQHGGFEEVKEQWRPKYTIDLEEKTLKSMEMPSILDKEKNSLSTQMEQPIRPMRSISISTKSMQKNDDEIAAPVSQLSKENQIPAWQQYEKTLPTKEEREF